MKTNINFQSNKEQVMTKKKENVTETVNAVEPVVEEKVLSPEEYAFEALLAVDETGMETDELIEHKMAIARAEMEVKLSTQREKYEKRIKKQAEKLLGKEHKDVLKVQQRKEALEKKRKERLEKNIYDPANGADAPYFEVELCEMFARNGKEIPIQDKKAVVDITNEKVLSQMSNEYQLIPNRELVDAAISAASTIDSEVYSRKTFCDGKKFHTHLVFPNVKISVGNLVNGEKDEVSMECVFRNSYDGSRKVGFELGGYRLVCSNGLKAYRAEFAIEEKHLKATLDKDAFIENIGEAIEKFTSEVQSQWEKWNNQELTAEEIDEIFAAAEKRVSKTYVKEIQEELEKDQKEAITVWILYNYFTKYFTHSPKCSELRRDLFTNRISQLFTETY